MSGAKEAAERPQRRRINPFLRLWAGRGYVSLAERYPAAAQPGGTRFDRQAIELSDRMRHKHVLLVVAPGGLYVRVPGPVMMFLPALLIPWSEVAGSEQARLFGRVARRLTLGRPTAGSLVVWQPAYVACRQYLRAVERAESD